MPLLALNASHAPTGSTRALADLAVEVVFDQLPQDALRGTAVVLAATAAAPHHFLALDTGGRALVASLGGWTVPTVVYATKADFTDGVPNDSVRSTVERALGEAALVSGRTSSPTR